MEEGESILKCVILHLPISFGWKQQDRWYYGVRYARGCHPDDLWKTYFTSSKYVQTFREEHGEPDVVEIRQIFNDSLQAREWESKVLQKINAVRSQRWLNLWDQKSNPGFMGRQHSEETRRVLKEKMVGKHQGENNPNFGKSASEETRRKMSVAHQGQGVGVPRSRETRQKISENNKGKTLGRSISDEHKKKISEALKGKVKSETHIKNLIESKQLKGKSNG